MGKCTAADSAISHSQTGQGVVTDLVEAMCQTLQETVCISRHKSRQCVFRQIRVLCSLDLPYGNFASRHGIK